MATACGCALAAPAAARARAATAAARKQDRRLGLHRQGRGRARRTHGRPAADASLPKTTKITNLRWIKTSKRPADSSERLNRARAVERVSQQEQRSERRQCAAFKEHQQ